MARLTILMPAYNTERFVEEALESLLNQSFSDFELWIIDDGSTDRTRSIMDQFQDTRIKRFYHNENRGRVKVVNELVYQVNTEYFTITDADDVSQKQRLEQQISYMDDHKELMMCGTSYTAIDENGFVVREMNVPVDYELICREILDRPCFHGPTTIMRRNVLDHFPEFYREYFKENMADSDLTSRIVDRFKAVNLPERLYYYRIVKTSVSRKNFTPKFSSLYAVISFLSKQRRPTGSDSLDRNDMESLEQIIKEITAEFARDRSLLYQKAGFYYLYWKVFDQAWFNARKAWFTKPFKPKNIFLVIYTIAMAGIHVLSGKKHYKETIEYLA